MNHQPDVMWVHLVRTLAVFGVVVVHSAAQIFFLKAPFGYYAWWVGNVYDSSVRTCVPLLFMVSGFLLLGKAEPTRVFWKKRVRKVVVPLLLWSMFFLLWIDLYEVRHPSAASTMTPQVLQFIHDLGWKAAVGILVAPVYYHLWFLYALLVLYLLVPLLRPIVRAAPHRRLWWILALWAALSMGLEAWVARAGWHWYLMVAMVASNAGYLLLGYVLGRVRLSRRLLWAMAAAVLLCDAVSIAGTYWLTGANGGKLDEGMWQATPNMLLMAAAVFLVMRGLGERWWATPEGRTARALKSLSAASFGVYLVHVLLLYVADVGQLGFRFNALTWNPAIAVPVLALGVFAGSALIVRGLQKVPIVRHAVP